MPINHIFIDENKKGFEDIKKFIEDINIEESNKIYRIEQLSEKVYFSYYFAYYIGQNYYMEKFKFSLFAKISNNCILENIIKLKFKR